MLRELLTIGELKEMKPFEMFACGELYEPMLWAKGNIRWVAVRGSIYDWAIYYHLPTYSYPFICKSGDKCVTKEVIRKLVHCDDESFELYRLR